MQTKLKNLITGNTISKGFHQGEEFEETETEKIDLLFIYTSRDKYIFSIVGDKSKRIELTKEQVGAGSQFLKQNQAAGGLVFNDKIIAIALPIKVQLKVTEAPPSVRGNRAEAGTKQVTLETGAIINAPLFIKQDDVIEINTQTGEYVKRIE